MNYYERHLGDYARNAGHLSMLEHGAYTLLLDRYYTTGQPIPESQAYRLCRAVSDAERQAVDAVLFEFFTLANGLWSNRRADEELSKAQVRIDAAQKNGKKGGRPKANGIPLETHQEPSGLSLGTQAETQVKAHHAPPIHLSTLKPKSTVRTKPAPDADDGFKFAWGLYPKRGGSNSKADAHKAWIARLRDGETALSMTGGAQRYAEFITATGKLKTEFVMQACRFFGASKHYLNDWALPAQPAGTHAPERNMAGLMALEEMKHGLVPERGNNGHSEAGLLGFGASASGGRSAGNGNSLAGGTGPRIALGSGNGHAPDSRGVLDLGPDGFRVADPTKAD